MTKFSELLKATRGTLQRKIEEVAESSDLAMSVVSRLENNLTQPTVISLVKLAYGLSLKSYEVSKSLGVNDYYGRVINSDKSGSEEPPLFIGDIEAFLEFVRLNFAQAKEHLYSSYEEVVRTANPNMTADEVRKLAWDSVKDATFPMMDLYTPLPYPSSIEREYLQNTLVNKGILIFSDVGHFIRKTRANANLSLRDLDAITGISYNTISRLERGMIDRLFLDEIIKIDQALETDGLIFNMFWAAGEFHSGVSRNKFRELEIDPPLAWTEREHALATTVVKIERWSVSLNIPYLREFRNLVFNSGIGSPANQDDAQG